MPSRIHNPRVTRWCFTINNYTDEEYEHLRIICGNDTIVKFAVMGREVGDTGTPHLQGFVILASSQRLSYMRDVFSPRGHFETTRSSNATNVDYCRKDGSFVEFGRLPSAGGARNDLIELVASIGSTFTNRPPTSPEIARSYPYEYIRFPRLTRCLFHNSPPVILRVGTPRFWQSELSRELLEPANDRSVIFYVDPVGNTGKSWFIDWFFSTHPDKTQIMMTGKYADLAYVIDPSKNIVLFDVPRGGMEHLSYRLIESLKNRRVLSTKYAAQWKFFHENVHVVVFTNEDPIENRLSDDRMIIRSL